MTTAMIPPSATTPPATRTQTPPRTAAHAGPRPRLWTCAEFHDMGDAGAFEGRRAKLIDGVILEEGAMNPPHATTLVLITEAIQAAFGVGWHLRGQMPMILGQDTDPMPDLAVVRGRARDAVGHPATADLVVEVSDTSLAFDTGEKRLLYARAGIADYWVVDVNGRRLLVYRDPQNGDYADLRVFVAGDSLAPLAVPASPVRVADLLA